MYSFGLGVGTRSMWVRWICI